MHTPRCRLLTTIALAGLALAISARAEVIESSAAGFATKNEALINAAPATVYAALTEAIGKWWDPVHTFSHDARNLSLEARPGGCLCERLPDGGGVEHMRVIYASPARLLRMTGAIGPMQEAAGTMTWTLSKADKATKVQVGYAAGGFRVGGFHDLSAILDRVTREQLLRLKAFVETGHPDSSSR